MLDGTGAIVIGALCLAFVLVVSIYQIVMHLKNYTEPLYQRYILRIIFIVPVTTITSYCSLLIPEESIWFDTVRQWYEAWVIYNFTCLLLAYVGGPGQVELKLDGKHIRRSCLMCTCCFSPDMLVVNGRYVKWCKRMTLQFVYAITPMSVLTVVLFEKGLYEEGNWSLGSSYIYITLLYNISYGLALSALFYFYYGTHELLEPYHPVLKFVVIKGVVFLTFWQGVLCSILHGVGIIESAEDAKALQNFLILLEMVVACVLMRYAFPYTEYQVAGGRASGLRGGDIRHAVSIHDVVTDTYQSFAPAYHDYVLYSDSTTPAAVGANAGRGGEKKKVRKSFRMRTFLMMGKESSSLGQGQAIDLMKDMEMGLCMQGNGDMVGQGIGDSESENGAGPSDDPNAARQAADLKRIQEDDPFMFSEDGDLDSDLHPVVDIAQGVSYEDEDESRDNIDADEAGSGLAAVAAASRKWVHIDLNDGVAEKQE